MTGSGGAAHDGAAARAAGRPTVLVVIGPTAVGKSEFALAACERFGGELVSVDSMQVYRGLDAGTGKPGPAERRRVPHHGVDLADPADDFSLGEFVRTAGAAVAAILDRGRLPVLVGGTGLYLRGLLKGVIDAPSRDAAIRSRLREIAGRRGTGGLHRMLGRVDGAAAARVGINDLKRLVRALEVFFTSRRGLSEWIRESPFGADRYDAIKIGLTMRREALAGRIDERVRRFFAAGLLEEIGGLVASGCPESANALTALGYREGLAHLKGEIDREGAIALTQRNTRRYAKRQRTWFRREEGVAWFDVDPSREDRFREAMTHAEQQLRSRGI